MLILSKCPQIYTNMMSKQTGQLSLPTNFLTFAGSLARVFTTIQDVGYDASLLSNCSTNAVLSGVLVIQVVFLHSEHNCFLDAFTLFPLSFFIRNFTRSSFTIFHKGMGNPTKMRILSVGYWIAFLVEKRREQTNR